MNNNVTVLLQHFVNYPACHNMVWKRELDFSQYIITLITSFWLGKKKKQQREKMVSMLEILFRYIHPRGWEIKPTKIQKSAISIKFSGSSGQECARMCLQSKKHYCILHSLLHRKKPLGFWKQHFLHLGILCQAIYWCHKRLPALNVKGLCSRSTASSLVAWAIRSSKPMLVKLSVVKKGVYG